MKSEGQLLSELSELRARVKILEKNEIRLKRVEGELQASNQQLDASNQQLEAGEQQLRALNAQLKANENELIKKEAFAQNAREYAENIISTVREPLLVLDENLRVISVSRFFCSTFQVSSEETEGKLLYELGNKQWDIPVLKGLLNNILPKNKIVENFEIEHDFEVIGEKIMLLNARELRQEKDKKRLILLSIQDITDQRNKEKELIRLNAELGAKKDELQQLMYITTHDLRSPLVNIQGFNKELGLSIKELKNYLDNENVPNSILNNVKTLLEDEIPEAMHYISSSTAKMDALLSGLLVLSRLDRQRFTPEKLKMNQLIEEVLDNYKFKIKKQNVLLNVRSLPDCYGDKLQINQLFSNLIDNALKFFDPDTPGKITISGKRENEFTKYYVEDNGIGIRADYLDKVFELFHKLDPKKPGIGLGMSIVTQVTQRHNGKIEIESEPGIGTKISILIPN